MSQCVPCWDLDDNNNPNIPLRLPPPPHSISNSLPPHVPMLDYEVAELTWENGQLAMHGLGPPRVPTKPLTASSPTWEKPRAGGTLESIVNQATRHPHAKSPVDAEVVPWFNGHHRAANSGVITMDAMVPCSKSADEENPAHVLDSGIGTCGGGGVVSSTGVGSCSGAATYEKDDVAPRNCASRLARVPVAAGDWSSRDQSVSCSGTFGMDSHSHSQQVTLDTCEEEGELGVGGFTSTSLGSPENTSSSKLCTKATTDDHDSVCHSRPQRRAGDHEEDNQKPSGKSIVSNKRSRAAAIHNQSERKRRDKINQRMKMLQKLVPNSSKTDKASMLDEVIEYVKQLQAQVQVMNRVNMSSMMLPMTLQQQLQMSMMAPMGIPGMGMGMGMPGMGMGMPGMGVMDLNTMGRPNIAGIPPGLVHPSAFMSMPSWNGVSDRLARPTPSVPDPLSAFLAFQSQAHNPATMEAYSRMAALYQQMHQASAVSGPKN